MKTQEIPPILRGFHKVFERLCYRHDYSRVFDDFLTIAMCVYAWQTEEKRYLEVINGYDRKELDLFARLMAEWLNLHSEYYRENKGNDGQPEPWFDSFGTFYEIMRANYGSKKLGQFFTPPPVCDLMAQLTFRQSDKELTINDPCCGSGRLLMAMNALQPGKHLFFAGDLDHTCVKMTCLNMFIHGMRGQVWHINSLTMEYFGGYVINHKIKEGYPGIIRLKPIEAEHLTIENAMTGEKQVYKNLELNF